MFTFSLQEYISELDSETVLTIVLLSVTYMQFSHSKASKIEISPKHSPFSTIRDICHRECKGYGAFTRRKTGYSM